MLNEAIDSAPSKADWFGDLVVAWKAGDTTKLDELLNETSDPGIHDLLIACRSRFWMTAILNEIYYGKANPCSSSEWLTSSAKAALSLCLRQTAAGPFSL